MRLIVARCEVQYSGRLSAVLPEALRLLMLKADGSVLVHADAGGYKPLNWMTPPTAIEESDGRIVVRKLKGDDALDIRIAEVLSDVTYDMGSPDDAAGLVKDGVERDLQELLAGQPEWCGEGFRLVRREWPTDIGPVDLMCRDEEDGWVAVEIKRVATIDAVEQLHRYLERIRLDPAMGDVPRRARRAGAQAAGARARGRARDRRAWRSTSRCSAASASPTSRSSPRRTDGQTSGDRPERSRRAPRCRIRSSMGLRTQAPRARTASRSSSCSSSS